MSMRSSKLSRWLLLAGLLCCSSCQSVPSSFENKTGQNDSRPRIFSPRMDYDEWTPLGRGDPLKNNPTFDYVPPVLDRVQYWLDSHTTEPSSKRDILVLGVTAKKTSPKIPEHFLKFVDGPKFTRTSQETSYRNDFTGSSGAEPPKLMRTTSFRNGLVDYRNQNRLQSLPASYYPSSYYSQKMKPYTMMMPPPMIQKAETSTNYNTGASKDKVISYADKPQPFSTQTEEGPILHDTQYYRAPSKNYGYYSPAPSSRPYSTSKTPSSKNVAVSQIETIKSVYTPTASQQSTKSKYETTTAPAVSFEKSNLIYQSTQTLSAGWLGNNGPTSSSSTGFPDVNRVTWQTPDYSKDHYDHHAMASSNHEVVVGQNADIIVEGNSNENEEVVIGQKEVSTESTPSTLENVAAQTSTAVSTTTTEFADQEEEEEEEEETEVETVTDAHPSQKMHIVVANSPSSIANLETHKAKKGPVAVVMPTNYVEKIPSDSSTTVHNALGNPITLEMTKTTHQAPKSQPQPTKNAVTNSPISTAEQRQPVTSVPNKMMPPSQASHQSLQHSSPAQAMPSRHVGKSPHSYMPLIPAPQSLMYPNFRPSVPISYMSPPMMHMRAPPIKGMMGAGVMDQPHQRPAQSFPVPAFTNPPSPSTMSMQTSTEEHSIDHRPSRLPVTSINSMTTSPPFIPTISSTMEYASTVNSERQETTKANQSPLVKVLSAEDTTKMKTTPTQPSSTPPRTTTVPSLTTDPIFSHYKQPAKPIRGPMYLIIQGHSKVKTYKPTVSKHSMPMENNEIIENITERQLSKLEQLIRENTKNGADPAAEKRKLEEKARAEKRASSQQDSLMSLVESGLDGFTVSPATSSAVTEDERRANSVTSIAIN